MIILNISVISMVKTPRIILNFKNFKSYGDCIPFISPILKNNNFQICKFIF